MEQPSVAELAESIGIAAKKYSNAPDFEGVKSRTAIRSAARQLLLATMTPDELCWDQVLHVNRELSDLNRS